MEYLGTFLKDAREKKGISLDEVYKSTKIPKDILNNIETDRISTIDSAYLKGYLKIYSKYLGLETTPILEAYKNILLKKETIIPIVTPIKKKHNNLILSPRFNLTVCLNIFVVLFLVLASAVFIRHVIKKKIETAVVVNTSSDSDKKTKTPLKKTEKAVSPQAKNKTKLGKLSNVKLAIQAKENTYVRVKVDGRPVFQGVLRRGQIENWTAKKTIELFIGSAGSVNLEVNGRLLPPLGRRKQPIKNMIINHDGSIKIK